MTLLIRPQAKKFYFYNIIAFDTETFRNPIENGEKLTFFNLDFYDGEQHYYSEKNNFIDMLSYFKTKYKKYTVIAHNIGFDFRIVHFINNLMEDEFLNLKCKARLLDSVLYVKFTSNNDNYVIQFLDSKNYFPMSLEKLAKNFNLGKINIEEYDLDYEEWNLQLYKTGKIRVMTDTEILYKAMQSFINMGFNYGVSLASTSFNTFKKQYLKRIIYLDDEFINLSLDIYHGGIVMPYILSREKQLYDYDINSLYPYVMKNYEYSYKLHNKVNDYRYIYDHIKDKSYNYLLNITYKIDNRSPILDYYNGRLIPFLSNTQWITSQEYVALYDNNASIIINEAWEFYCADLFSSYIVEFYKKRLEAQANNNDALSYFYKILLNSLYGKWAQHKSVSEYFAIDKIEEPLKTILQLHTDNERLEYDGNIYSIYDGFVTKTKELPIRYNPLIASEITANARIINYLISQQLGWDNLYYTDTDSFFINKRAPSILLGNELGKLKIDDKGQKYGNFTIYSPKDYEWEQNGKKHVVLKGVKFHPIPITNIPKEFINKNEKYLEITDNFVNPLFKKENRVYAISEQWSGIKSRTKIEEVLIEYKEKELKRENYKMRYEEGIGYEWKDKKEYDNRVMIIAK